MSKLFSILLWLLTPVIATASERITLINWYPAGGSIDQYYQMIKKDLERDGHTVDIQYVKTCGQALTVLRSSKNSFTVTTAGAFIPQSDTSSCRGLTIDSKSPKIFSSMYNSSLDICYSKQRQLTQTDILQNNVRIGVVAESTAMYLEYWIKKANNPNLSMVPYNGGGDTKRAILAGDIDVWFGSHGLHVSVDGRYHCFASSMKNNPKNLPFMGSIIRDQQFPEMQQVFVLWSSEQLDARVTSSMTQTFKTNEYKEFLAKGNAVHTGVGVGNDVSKDIELLRNIEKFYSDVKSK